MTALNPCALCSPQTRLHGPASTNERRVHHGLTFGSFKATDTGYTGTVKTLTHKITADFKRVLDRTNGNAPAYEIYSDLRIGTVWDRTGKSGKYLSVSLENLAFPRATTTCTATVVSRMATRWCSSVRAPRRRRRHQSSRLRKAEEPEETRPFIFLLTESKSIY